MRYRKVHLTGIALIGVLFLLPVETLLAEAELPFVVGAGGGAVIDAKNGVGWAVRLDGSGHPGRLSWLQAGLEAQYFARPERLVRDEKEAIPGGDKRTRRWSSDGGFMAGPVIHFPFGFGELEKIPEKPSPGMGEGRRRIELAPMISGGIFINGTTWRETVTKSVAPKEEITMKDSQGNGKIQGAYAQAGGRFRWTVLEVGIGAQMITRRPLQGVAWVGFDVPW